MIDEQKAIDSIMAATKEGYSQGYKSGIQKAVEIVRICEVKTDGIFEGDYEHIEEAILKELDSMSRYKRGNGVTNHARKSK